MMLLLLVAVTVAVLYPVVTCDFVNFDDTEAVLDNMWLRDFSFGNIHRILTSRLFWKYQPVTFLTYLAEYQFFELAPWIYHLDNLLLHAANTVLVFFFLQAVFSDRKLAFFSALLFGIHPLHVEPVAWVTSRKDVLFTFFYLLSLLSYIKSQEKSPPRRELYILSLLLFVFSVASKEMALTLPLIILLIDWYAGRKPERTLILQKLPYFAIAVAFGFSTWLTVNRLGVFPASFFFDRADRLLFTAQSLMIYAVKLFVPAGLSCFHPLVGYHQGIFKFLVPFLFSTAAVCWLARKNKLFVFGTLFFFLTVFPALHLVIINDTIINERYVYLPLVGAFTICVAFYLKLFRQSPGYLKTVLAVVAIAALVILGIISHNRTLVWKNSETLWRNVLAQYPTAEVAHHNLGSYYASTNNYSKAIVHYKEAIRLIPCFHEAHYNLGNVFASLGLYNAAGMAFTEAIKCKPFYTGDYYNNRGRIYYILGQRDKAVLDFTTALQIDPKSIVAYDNRAKIYNTEGNFIAALNDYEKILELPPRDPIEGQKKMHVEKTIMDIYKQLQNR